MGNQFPDTASASIFDCRERQGGENGPAVSKSGAPMLFASQFGQDHYIDRFVTCGQEDGIFVDVGAHDGVTGSNTLFFERARRWTGLLVEPVECNAVAARRARLSPCIECAVGAETAMAGFLEVMSGYTQMSGCLDSYPAELLRTVRAHPEHRERIVTVSVRPLAEILHENGLTRVDYISLDVEGAELAILRSFPFREFDIGCWSIENNGSDPQIGETMEKAGYTMVERLGVDDIYVTAAGKTAVSRRRDNSAFDRMKFRRAGTPELAVGELHTPMGSLLYPSEETIVGRCLAECSSFSPEEAALYEGIVAEGATVVDAGAHVGWFTSLFARLVGGGGRVHAFGPQRPLFELLAANVMRNGLSQVLLYEAALGSTAGIGKLADQNFGVPGNYGGAPLIEAGPGTEVPVMPIDALGLSCCNLIKADVQGMERDVLIGAAETIERCRPLLYLENELRDRSPTLLSTLFAFGYRIFWHRAPVAGKGMSPDLAALLSPNLLCIPEERDLPVSELPEVSDRDSWWRDLS